jgi:starch synthase
MRVLHTSTECYPAAKIGGLGDVVGSLPKYLPQWGIEADVIIPKYDLPWLNAQNWKPVFRGEARLGIYGIPFTIVQLEEGILPYPLYTVDIPGKFDRPGIYADPPGSYYWDEQERYTCFQQAILQWCIAYPPDILHCHDHHTGLIPFMVNYCPEFGALYGIPTVFSIHNGRYHGAFGWERLYSIPYFNGYWGGLIEWNGIINPLAAGIKCAVRVTTVSNAYLDELRQYSNGLESLFQAEHAKSVGILNGIDTEVWDPHTDELLHQKLRNSVDHYSMRNKSIICDRFGFERKLRLISFI